MSIIQTVAKAFGKGYLGNSKLRKPGVKIPWTQEQVEEFIKCKNDPVYFIETYIKITHVDHGIIPFKMRPFQRAIVNGIYEYRAVIGLCERQSGKCFSLNTVITLKNKHTNEVCEVTAGTFRSILRRRDSANTAETY